MSDSTRIIYYYDRFARFYDLVSSRWYYRAARSHAIETLKLAEGETILNIPCGTGQNFEYLQPYLNGTGVIIAADLSQGMLREAEKKRALGGWTNLRLVNRPVHDISREWLATVAPETNGVGADAVLCDLGLTTFSDWERAIDVLISVVRPGGRIVVMDWYIAKSGLRSRFINWIGKGDVNRPIWLYLKERVADFYLNDTFKGGDVFVASGTVT